MWWWRAAPPRAVQVTDLLQRWKQQHAEAHRALAQQARPPKQAPQGGPCQDLPWCAHAAAALRRACRGKLTTDQLLAHWPAALRGGHLASPQHGRCCQAGWVSSTHIAWSWRRVARLRPLRGPPRAPGHFGFWLAQRRRALQQHLQTLRVAPALQPARASGTSWGPCCDAEELPLPALCSWRCGGGRVGAGARDVCAGPPCSALLSVGQGRHAQWQGKQTAGVAGWTATGRLLCTGNGRRAMTLVRGVVFGVVNWSGVRDWVGQALMWACVCADGPLDPPHQPSEPNPRLVKTLATSARQKWRPATPQRHAPRQPRGQTRRRLILACCGARKQAFPAGGARCNGGCA